MAYTAYRTWTTGEIVTAALMNEQVKDNGLLTAPAIMTTAGDIIYASAANTPARLAKSTTSTQYLANTGTSNVPQWNEVALATGVSGTLPVANGGTGITSLGSNVATFLGTPSSANLRSALTDETGTGGAVFATSPTLVTPALGTPASGVLTNATGLPTAGILDNAVTLAKMAGITRGSIIYGDASGDPSALAKGTETYVLTAGADDISWAAASAGAVVREGGQTTEATMTATSAADLLSATSLTIAAAEPFTLIFDARKTTGATANAGIGLKLNSTVIVEATTTDMIWRANGSANEATSGSHNSITSPRIANYVDGGNMGGRGTTVSAGQVYRQGDGVIGGNPTAAFITAEITSIILRGISGNGSVTLGADEMHAYSWATS